MDPEQQIYYQSVKDKIKKENAAYMREHPEARQLLNDYFSSVLLHKPENVYKFTKNYFAFFNKKKEGQDLPALLIMGPNCHTKDEAVRRLLKNFPHLFEPSALYTTKRGAKDHSGRHGFIQVDREEFEQVV